MTTWFSAWRPLVPPVFLAVAVAGLLVLCTWAALAEFRSGRRGGLWTWPRRFALVVIVAVMGFGPSAAMASQDTQVATVDVFFVVDCTGSMAAEDYNGTSPRLDGVRADLISLTADVPGARYSIISFHSLAARQLPLTTDARAISSWAQTLVQEITMYSQGSMIDRPLDELTRALQGAVEARPANTRLVFFMSDGEQTVDGTPRSFADLAPMIDGGAVLGYGTEAGGRMKEYDPQNDPTGDGSGGGYIQDATGPVESDAISRIDEDALRELAGQLGVPYAHRDAPTPTAELVAGLDPELVAEDGRRGRLTYRHVVWPFALGLAVLLGFEAWSWGARVNWGSRGSRGPSGSRQSPESPESPESGEARESREA